MWKWRISPFFREVFLQLLKFSHLVKGRLKFQLDLERTNTSHVFTLLGVSWVKSTVTTTCKTDAFYMVCSMVYVQVAIVAYFSHVHQMFQTSSIMDIPLDMGAVHETTKSKMITKFTGLRNVILLSRLSVLQLFVCQCMQCVGANFFLLFSFSHTYLLTCIIFLFALRYFVNYAPLLGAVCKFGYSLLSRPFFIYQSFTCLSV